MNKMIDITVISALLNSVKTATEIANLLKGADISLEKAETKLQLADLISALADTKISASEVQELIKEKDDEIKRLKEALEIKERVIRHGDAYYEKKDTGEPTGNPYCSYCWEASNRLIHLHNLQPGKTTCPNCKNTFLYHYTQTFG
jgi:hypothetical protein